MERNYRKYTGEDIFTPYTLKLQIKQGKVTKEELSKIYSTMRAVKEKRFQRMEGTSFAQSKTFKENVTKFPKLKDIKDTNELATLTAELSVLLSHKTSTLSGQKAYMKTSLKSLHASGYNFINESNFQEFSAFMEEFHRQKLEKGLSSDRVVELFEKTLSDDKMREAVKQNFKKWADDFEASKENYLKNKERNGMSSEEVKKRKK